MGPTPMGKRVLHRNSKSPDNSLENLFFGTMQDAAKTRNLAQTTARGETHGRAKLKEAQVLEIRESQRTNGELALKYQVSRACIEQIRKRKIWTHI